MRERLQDLPAETMVQYLLRPAIESDLKRSYTYMLEVNKVHLIMLVEKGIIPTSVGQKILIVIEALERKGAANFEVDPNLECLYCNIESYIIKQVGVKIGGQLHTGRSRNDIAATVNRLISRDWLLKTCDLLNQLRLTMIKFAANQMEVVMPGYTHLQPAEPITMAHYFSAILHAIERDYQRLYATFDGVNICPLGSGAMASTSFPIDRGLTAELLGFDTYTGNSLDGVAARDYILEILSALNIFMSNLSRFAQDLYIWSTQEFALIEVGNSVAVCSSIMPQKKNPITLEHIKAKAAHVQGALVSASSSLKNTPYTHCRDISAETMKLFWQALEEVEAAINLAITTINTLQVNKDLMLSRCMTNFCTVTELANYLVRYGELSFREAHEVVALLINSLLQQKQTVAEIDNAIIAQISSAVLGTKVDLSEEKIREALDPVLNVRAKSVPGGPAPQEVKHQLERLLASFRTDTRKLTELQTRLDQAKVALAQKSAALNKGGGKYVDRIYGD